MRYFRKRHPFLLLLFLSSQVEAQQNVVILVDVSGSIPQAGRIYTKEVVKEILQGNPISNSNFYYEKDPNSTLNIPGPALTGNGARVLLIPFGNKITSDKYNEIKLANFPGDLINFIDSYYPTFYSDGFTYLTLAKAKAAQLAKLKGMNNYLLLLVSDNISDYTGGKSPNYTSYEQQLVDNYNSKSNPVMEGGNDGFVRLKGNSDFKIPLRNIDVSKFNAVPRPNANNPASKNSSFAIEFAPPYSSATRKKPVVTGGNSVNVSWLCKNCPDNIRYNVIITQVEGGKFKDAGSKNISTPSVSKKLESGIYKIFVTGEIPNSTIPVSSATTYVSVEGSGSLWWLWLLSILLLIWCIIYWNRERQRKKIREAGNKNKNISALDSGAYHNNQNREEF